MSYTKFYTGGSYGPGMNFPDNRCYFENCTFIAKCTFGDHCDFVNCTFVKCCPKYYRNVSKTGEHCRFFNCKLESVQVGPWAELYNTNRSGYLVTVSSVMPNAAKKEVKGNVDRLQTSTCEQSGQRINSKEIKTGCEVLPCQQFVEGESTSKVTTKVCGDETRK